MDEIYNRIENLCKARGIDITALCRNAGITRSIFTEYKKGRTNKLSTDTIIKVSNYLNTPVGILLGEFFYVDSWRESIWEDWHKLTNDDDRRLMLKHNGVPPELRDEAARIFGIKKETAQMDGLSESDKTILSLLDELSPQEREKAVAVLKALVDKQ